MSDPRPPALQKIDRLRAKYDTLNAEYLAAASLLDEVQKDTDERLANGLQLSNGTVDRIMGKLDQMERLADKKRSVLDEIRAQLDKIERLNTRGHPRSVPIVGRPAPMTIATEHNK